MVRLIIAGIAISLFGCASTDRLVPAPVVLPEAGATTNFTDLYPKIRQLAWRATEAFYRDDWKELGEDAQAINKAADLLKTAKEPPTRLVANLGEKCTLLASEAEQLRSAAQAPAPEQISTHLQKVHNLIRELRPEA